MRENSALDVLEERRQGRAFLGNRKVVDGVFYRYRVGILWRDLLREEFGAWQTVWKRHARYVRDCEPVGHRIGRSRGGLTTKLQALPIYAAYRAAVTLCDIMAWLSR